MQPPRGVSWKKCSENMQQIYRRTPMPKCDFSKVIEIALRHGCSPVNLLHIFGAPFPKNTLGRLFLYVLYIFDTQKVTLLNLPASYRGLWRSVNWFLLVILADDLFYMLKGDAWFYGFITGYYADIYVNSFSPCSAKILIPEFLAFALVSFDWWTELLQD